MMIYEAVSHDKEGKPDAPQRKGRVKQVYAWSSGLATLAAGLEACIMCIHNVGTSALVGSAGGIALMLQPHLCRSEPLRCLHTLPSSPSIVCTTSPLDCGYGFEKHLFPTEGEPSLMPVSRPHKPCASRTPARSSKQPETRVIRSRRKRVPWPPCVATEPCWRCNVCTKPPGDQE